jgi:hypothetical protein
MALSEGETPEPSSESAEQPTQALVRIWMSKGGVSFQVSAPGPTTDEAAVGALRTFDKLVAELKERGHPFSYLGSRPKASR